MTEEGRDETGRERLKRYRRKEREQIKEAERERIDNRGRMRDNDIRKE